MSETKTGVKIPVGWLRLDRGVKTLPGDWWWNHGIQQWCVVGRSMHVRDQYIIIRRCRYKVGEEVIVWKPSGYSPEFERGTAIIERVYASDHRGVQQVQLKKTGQSVMDSILTSCSSDILAPTFSTLTDRDSAPQMWDESDIINKIDPTNDPNVAPYLASEAIDEALQQAELTEEPQADHIADADKMVEMPVIKKFLTTAPYIDRERISDTVESYARIVRSDNDFAWTIFCNLAMMANDAGAPIAEANERSADLMKNWFGVEIRECELWQKAKPQADHSADANTIVELPDVKQSLTTEPPDGWRWLEVGEALRHGDTTNTIVNEMPESWVGSKCVNEYFALRRNRFEVGEKVVLRDSDVVWEAKKIVEGRLYESKTLPAKHSTFAIGNKLAPYIEETK